MSDYIFRTAVAEDVDFLVETIVQAEKSGSEIFSYSRIFDLSEAEVRDLFREMFLEEIEGCEFSIFNYIVAEKDNQPAAALCAWVENSAHPSSVIKGNLMGFYFPKSSILHAAEVGKITSPLNIPLEHGKLYIAYVSVSPKHRGKNLFSLMLNQHLLRNPEVTELSIQVMANNTFAVSSYERAGFVKTKSFKTDNTEIFNYLPGNERLLMNKKINPQ